MDYQNNLFVLSTGCKQLSKYQQDKESYDCTGANIYTSSYPDTNTNLFNGALSSMAHTKQRLLTYHPQARANNSCDPPQISYRSTSKTIM